MRNRVDCAYLVYVFEPMLMLFISQITASEPQVYVKYSDVNLHVV